MKEVMHSGEPRGIGGAPTTELGAEEPPSDRDFLTPVNAF